MRWVNRMSFREASSSSSWTGVCSVLSSERLLLGLFLLEFLFLEVLEVGAESDSAGRSGEASEWWRVSGWEGVMITGILLQMIGVVIRGALTLQPNAVLSKSSGGIVGIIVGGGIEKFISDAAVGAVGGQGIKLCPLCRRANSAA
jgi:hypothetical protein